MKRKQVRCYLLLMLLFGNGVLHSQTSEKTYKSKLYTWMQDHDFTITGGYLRATYKKQDLRVVHPGYNRDVRFFDVEAEDLSYFENIKNFEITATQHTIRANANFNHNMQLGLNVTHLNYGALTSKRYRVQGVWDGEHLNDTVQMSNYVKALYHTNGLNLWSLVVKKQLPLLDVKRIQIDLNLGVNLGASITSSEIEIKDTVGNKYLYFTPGNKLAGYHLGVSSSIDIELFKHVVLQPFWDWSFISLRKAPFYEGYVQQKVYANYYGVGLGYRF